MTITAAGVYGAPNPEVALQRINAERQARQEFPLTITQDPRKPGAYVNHGRWLIDCPNCGAGAGVWAETTDALCFSCGHRYKVVLPSRADQEVAEAILNDRPLQNQNWDPRRRNKEGEPIETTSYLQAENVLMPGVPNAPGEPHSDPPKPETPPAPKTIEAHMAVDLSQLHDEILAAVENARPTPYEHDPNLPELMQELRPGNPVISVGGQDGNKGQGFVQITFPADSSDKFLAAVQSVVEAHKPNRNGSQ